MKIFGARAVIFPGAGVGRACLVFMRDKKLQKLPLPPSPLNVFFCHKRKWTNQGIDMDQKGNEMDQKGLEIYEKVFGQKRAIFSGIL